MGRDRAAVFEGRDMGTVVFPDAEVKFFLDASPRVRALRRYEQLKGPESQSLAQIEADMAQRDRNDSTRDIAPLRAASDAIVIDSSQLSIDEVIDLMKREVAGRGGLDTPAASGNRL
jgi:cytidylate kinase